MYKINIIKFFLPVSVATFILSSFISFNSSPVTDDRWVAPASADKIKNPYPVEPLTLTQGEELYNMYCLPCHGENGYGDGAAGGALGVKPANFHNPEVQKQTDGALFWKIAEGRGNMPSFKKSLSEEQRWQLVVYLRKLGKEGSVAKTPASAEKPDTPEKPNLKAAPQVKTPVALRQDITVKHVMPIGPSAVRLLQHPQTQEFWYTTFEGDVFRIKNFDTPKAKSEKVFSAQDHGITRLQGAAFLNNTLFLCGNITVNNGKGTKGRMVRYNLASSPAQLTEVFNTVEYGTNATTFDHGWNALEISPDNKFIYVNTGARTDHGEVQDNKGAYPKARDNALTAKVYRFPVEAMNLVLVDDVAKLKAAGYIYAEGIRNAYDMAFNSEGKLFGVVNSGDYDHPEDMFWIRKDHHYGFPWVMGGIENPQQYPDWVPNPDTDPFISKSAHAWVVKYFHNDPEFPKKPTGVKFSPGVQNVGPAANEYRDRVTGKVVDGDTTGQAVSTFNAHCSPLGLFFDNKKVLADEYKGDGFVIRYAGGGRAATANPLLKEGKDLLHLKLTYNKAADNYFVKTTRLVENFNAPTDAVMVGNNVYIIEYAGEAGGNIWKITLPKDTKVSSSAIKNSK